MVQTKEIFVSKLSFRDDCQLIRDVYAYEYDGQYLDDGDNHQRYWLVNRAINGIPISVLDKNGNGGWIRGNRFTYNGSIFTWGKVLPTNTPNRKTFVSYYHHDDQEYRELFEKIVEDMITSKSVEKDEIDSDNSDEYVKQLIQKQYLNDVTVLVVLVGKNTLHRKHVDWEISGALNYKVGNKYSGLIGIILPNHLDYGKNTYQYASVPRRLTANLKSGYALMVDWTSNREAIQRYIEYAVKMREDDNKIINAQIPQMQEDTNE